MERLKDQTPVVIPVSTLCTWWVILPLSCPDKLNIYETMKPFKIKLQKLPCFFSKMFMTVKILITFQAEKALVYYLTSSSIPMHHFGRMFSILSWSLCCEGTQSWFWIVNSLSNLVLRRATLLKTRRCGERATSVRARPPEAPSTSSPKWVALLSLSLPLCCCPYLFFVLMLLSLLFCVLSVWLHFGITPVRSWPSESLSLKKGWRMHRKHRW